MWYIAKKVIARLKRVLVKLIPYNLSYKPKGVYHTVKEYIASKNLKQPACLEVYPSYTSNLDVSDEFIRACPPYLECSLEATVPPSFVVEVPNGRLHTNRISNVAVISDDNKVIGEVSLQLGKVGPERNQVFEHNYFKKPRKLDGAAFQILIGGSGDNNYFHWLFDALPRIHLLQKSGWFDKVDWFIVPGVKHNFQQETLRIVGIDEGKIVQGHQDTHIQADLLLTSTYVRYKEHIPLWACDFLRKNFLPSAAASVTGYPYVYVSRSDVSSRRILNEPELMNMLQEYGFKTVQLKELSFAEQVQLFSNAKVVVATHGAGLANLVFCNSEAAVVELFPKGYVLPLYYDLATKVGLNYNYMVCDADAKAENVNQGMKLNLRVDVSKLKEKLESLIEEVAVNVRSWVLMFSFMEHTLEML